MLVTYQRTIDCKYNKQLLSNMLNLRSILNDCELYVIVFYQPTHLRHQNHTLQSVQNKYLHLHKRQRWNLRLVQPTLQTLFMQKSRKTVKVLMTAKEKINKVTKITLLLKMCHRMIKNYMIMLAIVIVTLILQTLKII